MTATTLNPGDIAIVGYINNGTPDSFSFVNLAPIGSGTVIYFTDNGWTGTGFRGVTSTDADGNENLIKFTANADIPAGTVIRSIDSSTNFTWTRSGAIASGASGSYADLSLAQGTGLSGGDQITAVQFTGTTSPLFSGFTAITQIDYTGAFEDATTSNSGSVAPGLSQAANTAVLFGNSATYAAFNLNTLTSGTQAEWLAAINNAANWTFGSATTLPTGSINVAGGTGSQPDLTISLADSPDPVVVGNPLTYTLTVSNSGTANANGITVQYTLPNGVTFNGTTVSNNFTASQSGNIVTFTGGSINAGNNANLTVSVIPNTAGTLTSGTATVDPNNTITESNETNNTAATITTTVNTVQIGQAPTIQLNTASTTDLLDANGALAIAGLGAVSGVIGNANDPARILGLDFTIADPDTDVTNLTVTVSSSNTAVVPNANLTLTGSGASRNLKINPVGVGTANITVTVSDGSSTANYAIAYAASANNGTATTQFLTGTSDASTAIPVGGTFFLAGDDENQVLRLYDYTRSGLPVAGFDFTSSLGLTQTNGSGNLREVDIEATTRIGDRIFWLGSESNNDEGSNRPNRNRIFATDITGTGATTTLSYAGRYDFLRQDIISWDVNNLHGKGANYYGLAASAASGVGSKQSNGYNIEGLAIAPDNTTAYIAFRAPQVPPGGRSDALIVPVTNFASLLTTNGGTQGSAQFGAPIELDLGGRGIREIRQNANNQYLIIAGSAGEAGTAPNDFRLYTWDGNPNSAPQLRAATFPPSFNPEGIISIPDTLTSTSQIQFVSDDGDIVLYNDGTAAKDLTQNNFKRFRTDSITLGDVVLTPRIHDIQGASHISPLNGQNVADVAGIVTVVRSNGFYLQDPNPDNDDRTSEGIFVFTSSAPTVQVGDSILVNGRVSEFRPGGATGTNNLRTTQIVTPTISILSRNNSLPAATILGSGGRAIPNTVIEDDASNVETSGVFDPANDGIDFYESLEGTLVQINNPVSVSPTSSFGEIWVLADNGANATGRTARGGIVVSPGDFNPERIQIDDTLLTGSTPQVDVGATFSTITGVVDYSFSNFEVLPTSLTVTAPSSLTREVTNLTPTTDQLTVATFNVENLDIGDGATKFNNLANRIVNNLGAPDIISLEEIQDNNGPTNNGVVDASLTFQTLINAIAAAGGPTYQYRQIDPVNGTNGGEPGGNIRVGFLFNPNRVSFVDTPGGGSTSNTSVTNVDGTPTLSASPGLVDPTNTAFNSSRKPLVGEFTFNGQTVYIIGNHFNSKGGDQPLFGVNQPPTLNSEGQRQQQAIVVRNFVREILAIDPNANVVVLGDLNDFEFSNPVNTVESAGLTSLVETLPANERYTYNFEGNAQVLDHILASNNLVNRLDGYDVVHINSEFADQDSDHDPVIARFNLPSNQAPTAVTFNNTIASIAENSNTSNRLRVADIAIADDALGTNNLSLTGTDASFFEIDNSVLYLRANTNLDFETKSNYSVTVAVDDPTIGNTPDAIANFSLAVNDVNEAPTAVTFNNTIASIAENSNTSNRLIVADIAITDDALGTNNLSLTGIDASFFEIDNSVLYLRANTNLDFETKSNYSVTVAVDDSTVGNTPDAIANFSLAVNNVNEAPIANNDSATTTDIQPVIINVLANDSDPDSNPLTINNFTNPTTGNLVRNNDNTFTYTPQIGFSGADSFTYTISDGNLNATATVNLTVTLGSNQINGTSGNDFLIGTSRIDFIRGLAGNDYLNGFGSNDVLDGGDGGDILDGGAGDDILYGQNGIDILYGDAGNDTLIGGLGRDILTGGDGRDRFYLTETRTGNFDTIIDFARTVDSIVISKSEFGLNQALGTLDSSLLRLGTSATTASDRFIYDRSTGKLFFDEDGISGVAKVQIGQLSNRPAIANTDIIVIA